MERKVAAVLFADLVDSTGLVASTDPEVARQRVNGYFEVVASRIEAHGGMVEKFAGDAVMAAFGVPLAHEDDAERALRAALEIVPRVEELGLSVRIGVESGEVVIEDGDSTFATGEVVNLAARLQQAARPGEVLLGPAARRLAAGAVEVDDAGPIEIKGRVEPLWTWRAVRVHDRRRLPAAPFVGREPELALLENAFGRAVRDRRAQLVTIFGEPGLGKTRLVTEFLDGLERVTTLSGRTLPYGEGVTYWPLASMVKASAAITDDDPAGDAFEKLRACCESEAVADLLAAALGVLGAAEGERTPDQLSWAALRWAEELSDLQPLVLVFEDVHWAEEPLLDMIEYLARSLRSTAVVIVAVARPQLLDTRPSWGGGIRSANAIELAPLDTRESKELADALLARSDVPTAKRALVLERAEGNPLFLEEIAHALRDGGALEAIPDTVQALIAARIDGLEPDEKHVLQSAALVGRDLLARRARPACAGCGRCLAARLPRRPRVRRPGGSLEHHGRSAVPFQARPHPRRGIRRAEQSAPRGTASGVRRVGRGARPRRARGDPRAPPRPGGPAPRGARRTRSERAREHGGRGARRGRPARAEPRGAHRRAPDLAAGRGAGADARPGAISPLMRPGDSRTSRRSGRRPMRCSPKHVPRASPTSKGAHLSSSPISRSTRRAMSHGHMISPTRLSQSCPTTNWSASTTLTR